MAARKIPTYEVVSGCIQEGRDVFVAGQEYTPPNAKLEKQLLEQGVIARARPAIDSEDEAPPEDDEPPQGGEPPANKDDAQDLLSGTSTTPATEPVQEP